MSTCIVTMIRTLKRTLKTSPWAEPDACPILPDLLRYCFQNLKRETTPVFDRAAVFICTLVGDILQKLIWEVAVRVMKLYAIETCAMDRVRRSSGKQLHVFFDF
ncbi:hypothetical protein PHLCEN_2v2943 [Hermanssonia centrifuga]|uniref:Uncharacterized protein n=1 Tax=Hermanssonia centrifuga TaxID=98765 RepID=A0A2R6RIF6_9APHY|nr:hypothetical protein PHLCEN_2v2943 [Hermanssonia centrifuga]